MFENYLQKILKQNLGDFIDQIDSKELHVGLWSGKIDIKSLRLKKNLFHNYKLPLSIKYSQLKGLSLKIPWKSLFTSPLIITIESVLVLCEFTQQAPNTQQRKLAMLRLVENTIRQVGQDLVQRAKDKMEIKQKAGLIDNVTYKMLDNLYLSIKNIHIRFQESKASIGSQYSFGVSLQSMQLYAVDGSDEKVFIDRSKLDMKITNIRKKMQMRNLAIYCNYGKQELVAQKVGVENQKKVEQRLLELIFLSNKSHANNKNNYILVMNLQAVVDEEHRAELVGYNLNCNCQKLILKIDRDMLRTFYLFNYQLNQLATLRFKSLTKNDFTKEDEILLRKYCNAFVSDFKKKQLWNIKDQQLLEQAVSSVQPELVVEKVKFIVVNQMSVSELSKFLVLKAQQLDKGLMEVSKQINDVRQPSIKLVANVPQITLYLANEFSQPILQFNIMAMNINYTQKMFESEYRKSIQLKINKIESTNHGGSILSIDNHGNHLEECLNCLVLISNQQIKIKSHVNSLTVVYEQETIAKTLELFQLGDLDLKYKAVAIDKLQAIQQKVNKKVTKVSSHLDLQILIKNPKIQIKMGATTSLLKMQQIQVKYTIVDQCNIELKSCIFNTFLEKLTYQLVQPFDASIALNTQKAKTYVRLQVSPIKVNLDYNLKLIIQSIQKYCSINRKNKLISKCGKSGEAFLKKGRWKKCTLTLKDDFLYAWQNQSYMPLLVIKVKAIGKVISSKFEVLQISDNRLTQQVAFRDEATLKDWKNVLQESIQSQSFVQPQDQPKSKQLIVDAKLKEFSVLVTHNNLSKPNDKQVAGQVNAISCLDLRNIQIQYQDVSINNSIQNSLSLKMQKLTLKHNHEELLKNYSNRALQAVATFNTKQEINPPVSVDVQLGYCQIIYKPSVVLKILSFANKMLNAAHPPENISYHYKYLATKTEQIAKISIKLTNLTLKIQHILTNIVFGKGFVQDFQLSLVIKTLEIFVKGFVKQLSFIDLTNYPKTNYKTISSTEIFVQKSIVQSVCEPNSISFSLQMLYEGSNLIENGIKLIVDANANNIKLHHNHEVIMRLIDYINTQLLGILSFYPSQFPQFNGQKQRCLSQQANLQSFLVKEGQLLKSKYLKLIGKQKAQKQMYIDKPLKLKVQLNNSIIHLVNNFRPQSSLQLHIGDISIANDIKYQSKVINELNISMPFDIYKINLEDITLSFNQKESKFVVNQKLRGDSLNFSLQIQYFGRGLDIKYVFGQDFMLPSEVRVYLQVSKTKLLLNPNVINCIRQTLNYNISHQDGLAYVMYYQYFTDDFGINITAEIYTPQLLFQLTIPEENQTIFLTIQHFDYFYQRDHQQIHKNVTAKNIFSNYSKLQKHYEVIFANSGDQPKGTAANYRYRIRDSYACCLCYDTTTIRITTDCLSSITLSNAVCFLNMDYLIYLYKIILALPPLADLPKAYEPMLRAESSSQFFLRSKDQTNIELQKIIFSTKPPNEQFVFSCVASISVQIRDFQVNAVLNQFQLFIVDDERKLHFQQKQMKKRTFLRPTTVKFYTNSDKIDVSIGKCFFKSSINDLSHLGEIVFILRQKYQKLLLLRLENRTNKSSNKHKSLQEEQQRLMIMQKQSKDKSTPKKPLDIKNSDSDKKSKEPKNELQSKGNIHFRKLQVSEIQQMEKQKVFSIDTLEILIIDDINESLTPLLYGNLKVDLSIQEKANVQFYVDYFNMRNSCWQPIVQKNLLQIDYSQNVKISNKSQTQFLNINITSNFIENIRKTINHQELKTSRMLPTFHRVDKDYINSWILINQLGEDITCAPIQPQLASKAVFIAKQTAQRIPFLSNENSTEFKQRNNEELFVRLQLGNTQTIRKLKVNEMGLKRLLIGQSKNSSTILKSLYIDLSKDIKYLTLSSQIFFENKADLTLKLFDKKSNGFIYLPAGKTLALPYYSNLSSIYFSPQNNELFNLSFHYLQKASKIKICDKQIKVTYENRKLKKHFTFYPYYKITNYLPFPIVLNFKFKNQDSLHASLEFSSYQQPQKNFAYLYKSLEELQISVHIDGYHAQDFTQFDSYLQLKDYFNKTYILKCDKFSDNSPIGFISLTINFVLKNLTDQVFSLWVNEREVAFDPKSYVVAQTNHLSLSLKQFKSDSFYLPKASSEIAIKTKHQHQMMSESLYVLFRNKMTTETKASFNIFELLPKYLFHNKYKSNIKIRQAGDKLAETQTIKANSSQNLIWFLRNGKRRQASIIFTLQNSFYEWSFPINVQAVKQQNFLLRNRFEYNDVKYCQICSKIVKDAYQVTLKELQLQEIPYIIRNKTLKYKIVIQNIRITLLPNQQTYFCWDDPSLNQTSIFIKLVPLQHALPLITKARQFKQKDFCINFQIKVNQPQKNQVKCSDPDLDLQIINELNRQVFLFNDQPKDDMDTVISSSLQIVLPLRIALINNSISPASHLCDLTMLVSAQYQSFTNNKSNCNLKLSSIQLDNQTKPITYFPVVLYTDLQFIIRKQTYLEVELLTSIICLNIQQSFINDLMLFSNCLTSKIQTSQKQQNAKISKEEFFISRLILPKIAIQLEIQTKKFSIETLINLQKPSITSYPWKEFPYPIKTIAINILSHLSVSPWAFISSFGKGLQKLFTEQQASKGVQGFFQQLIGGVSNSLNGMLGIIVGHDIEKVQNFVDGLQQGASVLGSSLMQIVPNFQGDYSAVNIIKQIGLSVVNIVFKPVTGVLRMTLKITQGIRKTTKFEFSESQKIYRKRLPIVFFNRQQTYKCYSSATSELMHILKRYLGNEIKYFYLVDLQTVQFKLRNSKTCIALGTEELLLFDLKQQKLLWRVELSNIKRVEITNLCTIKLIIRQGRENTKPLQIDLLNQEVAKKLIESIEKLRKASSSIMI